MATLMRMNPSFGGAMERDYLSRGLTGEVAWSDQAE